MPPVMPGYVHADVPHEKTIAGPGYRYGCHSRVTGDQPRGRTMSYAASAWAANGGQRVATEWLPRGCGHDMRASDSACEGCGNRGDARSASTAPSLADDSFDDKALAAIGLSLCSLPGGEVSNRAELLVRPTDMRSDESGEHPGERFVLVTITREEVRALLTMMDEDVAEVRATANDQHNRAPRSGDPG